MLIVNVIKIPNRLDFSTKPRIAKMGIQRPRKLLNKRRLLDLSYDLKLGIFKILEQNF